jgi:predicted O-methyltransferase YrrM
MNFKFNISFSVFLACLCLLTIPCFSQMVDKEKNIDEKVKKFLESSKYSWRDMNVPESDGKILYDLIIKNKYKKALEVGTSTGHSAIWITWALSKTGGKLITIEIDEGRYNQAVKNFEEAGLSEFIDAKLADAHKLVPELKGPFDFIFIDADKDWYTSYAKSLVPKLEVSGCLTAHNVSERRGRGGYNMTGNFLDYMRSLPYMETSIVRESSAGISVSYKKQDK